MAWYNENGKDIDVALSSRVRFARNLAEYPFASKLTHDAAREVAHKVCGVLANESTKRTDFINLTPNERGAYVEMHLVSREFAENPEKSVLLYDEASSVAVMICEEDHVRLQCVKSGNSLDVAYAAALEYDKKLDALDIAYDERLGYLTHCPTNLGTGMRASVMLFLPALTANGSLRRLIPTLGKLGLTIRGMYGEGSDADASVYQISNQVTLGLSEEDILKKLGDVVNSIIEREREARSALREGNSDRLCDRVLRAYGTLRYAYLLSSEEFLKLYADTRLGVALGFLPDLSYATLDSLLVRAMPSMLGASAGRELDASERDRMRAELVGGEVS